MKGLSKEIWDLELSIMKSQLKLGEFKFGGRESEQYRFFKENTMNHVYEGTKRFFQKMEKAGLFERCECGANLRHGWTGCEKCGGSGWKDKEEK